MRILPGLSKIQKMSLEVGELNTAWVTFRAVIKVVAPEGYDPEDLLRAVDEITEYPDRLFYTTKDLNYWSKKLQTKAVEGTLNSWLEKHLL